MMNPLRPAALAASLLTCLLMTGCAAPPEEPPPAPPPTPSSAGARIDATAEAFEAFVRRVRTATRTDLAQEWAALAREPSALREALLLLLPQSPQHDDVQGVQALERLNPDERRMVLLALSSILADQRRGDERTREQLAQALERQRALVIASDKRAEQLLAQRDEQQKRADAATLRVEQLTAQLAELQRTLAALREIDRRLNQR